MYFVCWEEQSLILVVQRWYGKQLFFEIYDVKNIYLKSWQSSWKISVVEFIINKAPDILIVTSLKNKLLHVYFFKMFPRL